MSFAGNPVTKDKAITTALSFFSSQYPEMQVSKYMLEDISDKFNSRKGPELMHFFNITGGGFIIIAGDDASVPVLAYSSTGMLPEPGVSPAFDEWIDIYRQQLEFFRENSIQADDNATMFANYLAQPSRYTNPYKGTKDIAPFLRSTWNQDGYYNDMCPTDASGEALVGCVATAMAQVMFYYRFPTTGLGSNSYYANGYGTQSVNFGSTTYYWDQMLPSLSVPNNEVAKIGYHAGVSVEMSYGFDASGAMTEDVDNALESNFRYDASSNYKDKWGVNNTTWQGYLTTDLNAYRPVIYSGSGNSGGHAFIVDGYQGTNYFHFDWGWSGYANGYFYLTALNPAGNDFTNYQGGVFSIFPPTSSYPYYCSGQKTSLHTHGTIEDGSGKHTLYTANANCSWLIAPESHCDFIKITFLEMDIAAGDQIIIYEGATNSDPVAGTYSGSTLPSAITVSSSNVLITFTSDATSQGDGFFLKYEGHTPTFCSGIQTLTAESDTFSDGSDSYDYGNSSFCRWVIEPPYATTISLNFTDFHILDGDVVKVLNSTAGTTIGEYSGSSLPAGIQMNGGKMTVIFQSNAAYTEGGFNAFYTSAVGINENAAEIASVFPNPVEDQLNVCFNINGSDLLYLSINDAQGKVLWNMPDVNPAENLLIPVSNLAPGTYYLIISSVGLQSVIPFVKKQYFDNLTL